MFDIGFTELLVIALVALVVLGPERLPKVARILGHWTGRVQRFIENTRQEINREIEAQESGDLGKLQQDLIDTRRLIEGTSSDLEKSFQDEAAALEAEIDPDVKLPEIRPPGAKEQQPKTPTAAEPPPKKTAARKPAGTAVKPVKRVKTRRKNGVDA